MKDFIESIYYSVRRILRDNYYNLKYRCQRFCRGYADEDIWNMDYWFIGSVKKILPEFIARKDSHPADLTEEEWENILNQMNDYIKAMTNEEAAIIIYNKEEYELTFKEKKELYKTVEDNKNKFFELFRKYFYHMWY